VLSYLHLQNTDMGGKLFNAKSVYEHLYSVQITENASWSSFTYSVWFRDVLANFGKSNDWLFFKGAHSSTQDRIKMTWFSIRAD